jgi:hypothetical protein
VVKNWSMAMCMVRMGITIDYSEELGVRRVRRVRMT